MPRKKAPAVPAHQTFVIYVIVKKDTGEYLNKGKWVKELSKALTYTKKGSARGVLTSQYLKNPEVVLDIYTLKTDFSKFHAAPGERDRIKEALEKRAKLKEAKARRGTKEFPGVGTQRWAEFKKGLDVLLEKKKEGILEEKNEELLARYLSHNKAELERVFGAGNPLEKTD